MGNIRSFKELRVWQNAMDAAMLIFKLSKRFPPEEKYSLTDQFRRSSRSTAANIAEAWRKRRYRAAFISKLNDAESEAAETQTWTEFARRCGYLEQSEADDLDQRYEHILGQLVVMIEQPDAWVVGSRREEDRATRRREEDKATRGRGDAATTGSPCHPVTASPRPPSYTTPRQSMQTTQRALRARLKQEKNNG